MNSTPTINAPAQPRHQEPSVIASLDDDPARPTQRLLELSLRAASIAMTTGMSVFEGRQSSEPHWFDVWPGEHYRLLPALVQAIGARNVVEIGTFTGMGTLALLQGLPPGGHLTTFDLVPWDGFVQGWLTAADFSDGRLEQVLADVSTAAGVSLHRATLEAADFIFIDGPKDGVTEGRILQRLEEINLRDDVIVLFDDTRVMNMVGTWRSIARPKLDITSFGHWSGSGLVDWHGK